MKKVYVVLSRTGTGPSRLIRLATKSQFTHSSLALIPCRHSLYSFARRRLHNFLIAGFFHEDVDAFVFAKYPDAPCAVYEITVSDQAYSKMADKIAEFEKRYSKHTYSFTGIVTTQIGIRRELKYKYTCSQFVSSILQASEEIELPKHPSLMKPIDLTKVSGAKLIYSGTIKNISFNLKNDEQKIKY